MTMTMPVRPYEHPARQLTLDSRARGVCSVCDHPIDYDDNGRRRHVNELRAAMVTDPATAAVITALAEVIRASFSKLPAGATDADRARVAAEDLFLVGAARRSRAAWRRPFRRVA